MFEIKDHMLLDKLKKEENTSFQLLYKAYFHSILRYITNNKGNKMDAEDIFQEAILVLLDKVRNEDFELHSSLKTYLFAISKNLWLKRLRNTKLINTSEFDNLEQQAELFEFELEQEQSLSDKLIDFIGHVSDNCQQVLKAIFYYQVSMSELMIKMGWKNKHSAANQKYKCIQQVKREKLKSEKA